MIRDFFLVGIGSFAGGGLRFLVSRWMQSVALLSLPVGTLAVNVAGCFLIGLLSALPFEGRVLSPQAKILLTTGFCGGFTTFSTFIYENHALAREGHYLSLLLYVTVSLALGFAALLAGNHLAKNW